MARWHVWAIAGCVLIAAGGCGRAVEATLPPAGDPPPPSTLEVTCEATKTAVSATTVAAQRDGVHLRVTDASGRNGAYLNFESDSDGDLSVGGGDPVRAGTSSRVLVTPPGKILLNCSYDTGTTETTAVAVEVQDPEHHFRATTLAELGCNPIGTPTWAFGPSEGKTPDAAIRALLDEADSVRHLQPRRAPTGYIGAAAVTYLLDQDGRPWGTAVVIHDRDRFSANMDQLCGP